MITRSPIEIWFRGELSKTGLHAVTNNGHASTLVRVSNGSSHVFGLSDNLVGQVLDIKRLDCPQNGMEPSLNYSWDGYSARILDGTDPTLPLSLTSKVNLRCHTCGYDERVHTSNPGVHPLTTHLPTSKARIRIKSADWDQELNVFTEATANGRLILWVKTPSRYIDRTSGQIVARFPGSKLVYENDWVFILRIVLPTSAKYYNSKP